jgi:serine/threonine-protein kinase
VPAFTPAYAAPEQHRNEPVTTAADVYSLGVLLGELLTGRRLGPSDGRTPSARLRSDAPVATPAPEASLRTLRGDLDRILDKALAPAPDERYASAGAFAEDIERHLEGRPVRAHPPSPWYRARKFVTRHRGGVALACVMGLAIFASLALALWQARLARQEAARANTVRDFLLDVFDAARAFSPRDARPTPEALVEQARLRLANAGLDADTRAEVLRTLGRVDLSLAQFARAEQAFTDALTLAQSQGDEAGARAARLLQGEALQRTGRQREARAALEAELPALRATPGPDLLHALSVLGAVEFASGAPEAALERQREAIAAARALHGDDHIETLTVQFRYGSALAEAQRYPEAVATLEPLLERWRAAHAPEDDRYVAALGSLAAASDGLGDTAASEARLREVLALKRRIYQEPHHAIAASLREIALIVGRDGNRAAEAEELFGQALATQRAVFGEVHAEIAETFEARGLVLIAQRRIPEAQASYREALAICERAALRSEVCPRARNNLGMSLYREQKLDEAEALMRQALAERRTLYGNDHPTVAFSLSTLANVAAARGDGSGAVDLAREALATLERAGRGDSREGVLLRYTLANALWRAERHADALTQIDRVLADWQRVAPDAVPRRVAMLVQKAQILDGLGRAEDARLTAEEAIALGVPADLLQPLTRQHLRHYSGRDEVYPEATQAP